MLHKAKKTVPVASVTSEVGAWNSKCYEIRNRIIHGGYLPTFDETNEAISSAKELRVYIIKLIRANKKKYLDLNSFFIKRKSKDEPHIT